MRKTADFLGLSNSDRTSTLCTRVSVAGLLLPPCLSTSFGPPDTACLRLPCRRLPGLAPFRPFRSVWLAPPCSLNLPAPECYPVPTFFGSRRSRSLGVPWLSPLPASGPLKLSLLRRLSPGIACPFRVILLGTTRFLAEPGLDDMLSTT